MSNRVPRIALDYYPTPRSAIEPIKAHLPLIRTVCDPACGIGEIFEVFGPRVRCFGIELDQVRAEKAWRLGGEQKRVVSHGNALTLPWPKAEAYVFNPPFSDAEAFVRRGLDQKPARATMAVLLRLSFLEPTDPDAKLEHLLGRAELHRSHPPDVYVLAERPRFSVNKHGVLGTDSVTAAWFVYGPGRGGRVFWL